MMVSFGLAMLAGAVDASAGEAVRRHALLVGANDGGGERVTLRYAHDDARSMSDVLTQLGGVSGVDRTLLLDPSVGSLRDALGSLRADLEDATTRSEVIFYYSGHSDEEGLMLGEEHFGYPQLRAELETLKAEVRVAILDSCSSGAMIRSKGGTRVAPFLVDESNSVDGFAYITSSAADEVSQEAERIGGSYFTHYLASGLRGAADLSGDGRVTLDEAYAFAYEETLQRTERTQHGPQHASRDNHLSGEGNLVITDLQLTTASLVLDEALDGRALIRDDDGDLVAELLKPSGRAIELGLGSGSYDVVFTVPGSDRYAVATVTLVTGASTLLDASDLRWFDAENAVARGGGTPPTAELSDGVVAPQAQMVNTSKRRRAPRLALAPGLPWVRGGVDTAVLGLVGIQSPELQGAAVALGAVLVQGRSEGLVLSLGGNWAAESSGLQATLGANVVTGDVRGLQLSLGANAGQRVGAIQASLGGNLATAGLRGAQVTLGVNMAHREMRSLQASVGANVTSADAKGLQGTVGVNVAKSIHGAQVSVGANVAPGSSEGLQATVGLNVAGDLRGVQAGGVNVAKDVEGGQIGFVNAGKHVKGLQIGLVNVADDVDGLALGLLTIERKGRHDLLAYASESDLVNAEFKLGGDYFHTVFGVGGVPGRHAWYGLGWGGHAPMGETFWLDIDGIWQNYLPVADITQLVDGEAVEFDAFDIRNNTSVVRGRVTLGAQLAKQLAVFGGVSMAMRLPINSDKRLDIAPGYAFAEDREIRAWPGVVAGVQF
ncbi:MAG: caspase family protein [Myxococcales bacterium]|nr:caspase family protein [Myxococcales bacterium]